MAEIDGEYWMGRCYELWKLLDDIDTAGAMANRCQAKRWRLLKEGEVKLLYDMFYDPATDALGDE